MYVGCVLTCRGCSTAFWGSLFTLLLGWLVILVTGCLKMDAVCLTGRAVFRSGLPCRDRHTGTQTPQEPDSCVPQSLAHPVAPRNLEVMLSPGPAYLLPLMGLWMHTDPVLASCASLSVKH